MTDELFDYFGKGSKKFEPLDDDLDLPEVSPKRKDDAQDEAAGLKPVEAAAEPTDDIPAPQESDDDVDGFAGFGAGLFDASTDELPPRKQVAKAKPAAKAKPVVKEPAKPAARSKPAKTKPADPKPAVEEVAAVDQTEDSEGGTWDFLAGMLGIGGKKAKTDGSADETQIISGEADQRPTASTKAKPEESVESFFQEPKPAPEAAVDALFNASDDELDLAGWGDEAEEPVAAKPAKAERPARTGRGRNPKPAREDRKDRGRASKAKAPVVDDSIDDDIDDADDENFIEFEVEELTPSARDKKDAASNDGPRRRRRPARKSRDDDSVSDDDSVTKAAPRSRSRSRNDRDDAPSESRSGGRGRSRGRGRGRNQSEDREPRTSETVAKSDRDSGSDDWRDDKPEADSEQRSERSRGSRGRGRKRPERPGRDSKPFEEDSLDDELEVSSFVDDDGDDSEAEEAPKKPRRSRRPRSRSRGRSRSDSDRNDNDRDDSDNDSSDRDDSDRDSADNESSDRESTGRGSSSRGRSRKPRGDRDRDSESTPRRGRGSRDSRNRDDSRDEKPPVYAEVPTWDETIESMIESNIKNHESGAGRGRGGGGRSRGGSGGGGRSRGGNNNRNSNSRNRR